MASNTKPRASGIRLCGGLHLAGARLGEVPKVRGSRESSTYHHFRSTEAILWELTVTAFSELNADRCRDSAGPQAEGRPDRRRREPHAKRFLSRDRLQVLGQAPVSGLKRA